MRFFITSLVFICFIQPVFTQSFQEQIANAEAAYDAKNYLESAKAYEKAFKMKEEKELYFMENGRRCQSLCAWTKCRKTLLRKGVAITTTVANKTSSKNRRVATDTFI